VVTDLHHLGDEFRQSGNSIRSYVDKVRGAAAALEGRVAQALKSASASEARSLQILPSLIVTAEQALNEFRARQDSSAGVAADLSRQSGRFAQAIGEIVASVQFHDITRQQVEHVIHSQRELCRRPAGPQRHDGPTAGDGAVIRLQVAQLEHAASEFASALGKMDQHLAGISGQVGAMVTASAGLLGPADHQEGSFYLQIESSFRDIAEALAGCQALERGRRATVADVQGTLAGLLQSAAEIGLVESGLRRLALNAALSAVRLGETGAPLRAVATAMLGIQAECATVSAGSGATIRSVADAVQAMTEPTAGPEFRIPGGEEAGGQGSRRHRVDR
jgi:hypothetical protein